MLLLYVPDTRADNYSNWAEVLTLITKNVHISLIYTAMISETESFVISITLAMICS
jgi:hypothetical protein